jgi:hypothetical protein
MLCREDHLISVIVGRSTREYVVVGLTSGCIVCMTVVFELTPFVLEKMACVIRHGTACGVALYLKTLFLTHRRASSTQLSERSSEIRSPTVNRPITADP